MLEPARELDWEAVHDLSIQIHDLHVAMRPDIYCACDEPYPKTAYLQDVKNHMVYVARENGAIVGYVVLSILLKNGPGVVPVKQVRLDSICVEETRRGRGIGKAMIADVAEIASRMGCSDVLLGMQAENTNAFAFYKKCGFAVRTINMQKHI